MQHSLLRLLHITNPVAVVMTLTALLTLFSGSEATRISSALSVERASVITSVNKRGTRLDIRRYCSILCSMAQGGVLCNCNTGHFVGKRGPPIPASPQDNDEIDSVENLRKKIQQIKFGEALNKVIGTLDSQKNLSGSTTEKLDEQAPSLGKLMSTNLRTLR